MHNVEKPFLETYYNHRNQMSEVDVLFYDLTRDAMANNFVIKVYFRCLKILYQIAIYSKI